MTMSIGVVGYCPPAKFDEQEAKRMLVEAYDDVERRYPNISKEIVAGLTNVGVLAIAYREAVRRGWRTVGVACQRALEHELFLVDEKIIVGKEWGDESPTFVSKIDGIIRIGGGKQSIAETEAVRKEGKPVWEYNLLML